MQLEGESPKLEQTKRYFIKGSGTSFCLMNQQPEDFLDFEPFEITERIDALEDRKGQLQGAAVREISMGGLYLLVLLETGELYRLGTFDLQIFKTPQRLLFQKGSQIGLSSSLPFRPKISKIATGWSHTLMLDQTAGALYGMGSNKFLELGVPPQQHPESQMLGGGKQVTFLLDPVRIDTEAMVSNSGQNKPQTDKLIITNLCCGFRQSYLSFSNGSVFGCGESKKHELGIKSAKPCLWAQISYCEGSQRPDAIKKMVCSKRALFVLTETQSLLALGLQEHQIFSHRTSKGHWFCEALRERTHLSSLTPINEDIIDVEAGWSHLIVLKSHTSSKSITGEFISAESYGRNNFGQLGRDHDPESEALTAIQFQGQRAFPPTQKMRLCVGTEFSLLGVGDSLYAWGWNEHQNLTSKKEYLTRPQAVPLPEDVELVRAWTYPAITILQTQ